MFLAAGTRAAGVLSFCPPPSVVQGTARPEMGFVLGRQSLATCAISGLFPVLAQEKPVSLTSPASHPGEPPCVELDGARTPPAPGKQGQSPAGQGHPLPCPI